MMTSNSRSLSGPGIARTLVLVALTCTSASATAQVTTIRGFTDVTFSSSSDDAVKSTFGLGQFDLFISSRLTEHVSFLGEIVFEWDQAADEFIVDIERVLVSYTPKDYFRLIAGKHHTPIGYWNTAYHHGTVIQPTIQRPLPLLFEDEGGVLPIHTTGLQVSGRDLTDAHLSYDVLVGNGVGSTATEDNSEQKSLTASVRADLTTTLTIGASYYYDKFVLGTENLAGVALAQDLTEQIAVGFLAYFSAHLEVLSEYLMINHKASGQPSTTTHAFYAYAGYRLGRVVPYARFDELDYPASDPWFIVDAARQGLLGVRYDLGATAGIKIEGRRYRTDSAGTVTQFAVQFAVGF